MTSKKLSSWKSNGSLKRNSRQLTLKRKRKMMTACMDQKKKKKTFITGRR